jgi:hypothetical protein
MTDATCQPAGTLVPVSERERKPDRFVDFLECLADLLVETDRQRSEIAQLPGEPDPRAQEAIERLTKMQRLLRAVSVEAASVHQSLQRVRLI